MIDPQKLLAMRPANAVARLGAYSQLPLLAAHPLASSLEGRPSTLLCVPVSSPELLPALLRAARDADAVIGLCCPPKPGQRDHAERFFSAARAAAELVAHRRPIFLQAGPLRLSGPDPRAVAQLAEEAFRFVDAGFTVLSFELSRLGPDEAVEALREAAAPAVERELTVEVAPPAGDEGWASEGGISGFLDRLARVGLRPDFVRLPGPQFMPQPVPGEEAGPDFERLAGIRAACAERGVFVTLDDGGTPLRSLSSWPAAAVAKVDAGVPVARRILDRLPAELREGIERRRRGSEVSVAELLAQLDDPLATAAAADRDRIEALVYADTLDLLAALGLERSAGRIAARLARRGD